MTAKQRQNRESLKSYFKKGCLPSEEHFSHLIDSMLNIIDDGIEKTDDEGLKLHAVDHCKLQSFYRQIDRKSPAWSLQVGPDSGELIFCNPKEEPVLCLSPGGKVGVNTKTPQHALDVNGTVACHGRVGTFLAGTVPADGQWQTLIDGLDGCRAYEVMAGAGKHKEGKYALVHAYALSAFNSVNSITCHMARFQSRCSSLQLRWNGETRNFGLQIRTRCDYGDGALIQYNIAELWSDHLMNGSSPDTAISREETRQL